MSSPSWKNSLRETVRNLRTDLKMPGRWPRIAFVGVGQELRGDDAAGLLAVRRLAAELPPEPEGLLVLEAGPAPENVTGPLRRFGPDLVLFIDAAWLETAPGTIRLLDPDGITGLGASTHTLPLSTVAAYLQAELGCRVAVLGVRPGDTAIGAPLSPPVAGAVEEIVRGLEEILADRSRRPPTTFQTGDSDAQTTLI
ncbi:MAG TPA: hydrogenase 3 maturation endopeptidase HyCI [Anaerolineales bacterium]|nr:hydrogenase 3 maturation endopeptidase HyCI [Anaerolineales bacterium]